MFRGSQKEGVIPDGNRMEKLKTVERQPAQAAPSRRRSKEKESTTEGGTVRKKTETQKA